MLPQARIYLFFFLFFLIFIFICIIAMFICHDRRESFTPRVREMYRPYIRNARIYSEGVISDKKDNFKRLFRQFGL
jgi:hypothetical protein